MTILKKFFARLVLLSAAVVIAAAVTPSYANESGNIFWQKFREAIVYNQKDKIMKLTRFPFELRGVADSMPVRRYTKSQFPQVLKQVLLQPVLLPSQGHFIEKTMLQVVKEKPQLFKKDYVTADFIRVEQLEFQRVKGAWLLTGAYLEE